MTRPFPYLLLAALGAAPAPVPAAPSAVLVRAAEVHDGTGRVFRPGAILIENGQVRRLGEELSAPEGARVWDRGAEVVTPWLVDPHCGLPAGRGEGGRPEAALMRAADGAPRHDPSVAELRRRGLHAVGLVPVSGAGLQGRSATLGTDAGARAGAPVLRETTALCFSLPEDVEGSASRASARTAIERSLEEADAARRRKRETEAKKAPRPGRHVRRDAPGGPSTAASVPDDKPAPAQDVLLDAVDKKLPLHVSAARGDDARAVLALAEQRRLTVTLVGCRGCRGALDEVAASQAIVVLDPLHEPMGERHGLAPDPRLPGALAAAGARLAVTGGGGWPAGPLALRSAAAALKGAGVPEAEAVAAMTGRAAEAAGIADQVVIAEGRPARFLAWNGSPLSSGTRLVRAFEPDDFRALDDAEASP